MVDDIREKKEKKEIKKQQMILGRKKKRKEIKKWQMILGRKKKKRK